MQIFLAPSLRFVFSFVKPLWACGFYEGILRASGDIPRPYPQVCYWCSGLLVLTRNATCIRRDLGMSTYYGANNITLFRYLLFCGSEQPSRGLKRCWPRDPANFRGVGVEVRVTSFPRQGTAIRNTQLYRCLAL